MIDYDLFKEIERYAKRHAESSKQMYASRNQNLNNSIVNCLRGKIAEYECYFSMKEAGYILEREPDLRIYSESGKSYEPDLVCIGKNNFIYPEKRYIHVKSISRQTYTKYGASVLCEARDPILLQPEPNHFFSIMLQHSLTHYTFYKWLNSCDCEWKDPILNLPTKKALYLS